MTEQFKLSGNTNTGEVLAEFLRAQPELETVPVHEGAPLWTREGIEAVTVPDSEWHVLREEWHPTDGMTIWVNNVEITPLEEHDDQVDAALCAVDMLAPVRRSGRSPYLTGRVSPRWRLRHDPPVRVLHLNWPTQQVGDVDWLSPDASSMEFNLERTEHCWRDDCGAESDPESETGLCTPCRRDLRSRWTD